MHGLAATRAERAFWFDELDPLQMRRKRPPVRPAFLRSLALQAFVFLFVFGFRLFALRCFTNLRLFPFRICLSPSRSGYVYLT
jgi:hypothetical protein